MQPVTHEAAERCTAVLLPGLEGAQGADEIGVAVASMAAPTARPSRQVGGQTYGLVLAWLYD